MAQVTVPSWITARPEGFAPIKGVRLRPSFADRNTSAITRAMRVMMEPEDFASRRGFLQSIDPGARIIGMLILMIAASFTGTWAELSGVMLIFLVLALFSGTGFKAVLKRVALPTVFTAIIITPSFFGYFTPGAELVRLPYGAVITDEGLARGVFFVLRTASMLSFAILLVLVTNQPDFFRGLKRLPIPGFFITALYMTLRYLFVLLKVMEDSVMARKSRTIAPNIRSERQWFSSRAAFILTKSHALADEISMAMASRGFAGSVRYLSSGELKGRDYLWAGLASFAVFMCILF